MGIIRIVGGTGHAQARLRRLILQILAGTATRTQWQCLDGMQDSPPQSGLDVGPQVIINLDEPAPPTADTGQLPVKCHARLQIVSASVGCDATPLPESHLPRAAEVDLNWNSETIDSIHIWRDEAGETVEDRVALSGWLRLGLALAQARFEHEKTRCILSDALLDMRAQWAREIHSGPVQELVGATFLLGVIPEDAGEPAQFQIQTALNRLRRICQTLKPPALQDFGLVPALRAAIQAYGHACPGFVPQLDFDPDLPAIEARRRTMLFVIGDLLLTALLGTGDGEHGPQATVSTGSVSTGSTIDVYRVSLLCEQSPVPGRRADKVVRLVLTWRTPCSPVRRAAAQDEVVPQPDAGFPATALGKILPLAHQLAYAVDGDIVWERQPSASAEPWRQASDMSGAIHEEAQEESSDWDYSKLAVWVPIDAAANQA